MNKIDKVLMDDIKKMKGSILGFGDFDEKIINSINKNDNIIEFSLLSNGIISSEDSGRSSSKKILYRKIRRKFRKKNITNIIASYEDLDKYHRRFISDSLYLAKNQIHVFIKNDEIDVDIIKKRFERYHQECEMIECRDGIVLKITKKNYKRNRLRDTLYLFINFIGDGINFIGDLFVT